VVLVQPTAKALPEGALSWQQIEDVNGKKTQGEEVYRLRKCLCEMAGLLRWFMVSDF